jgi:hypothetical protein
MRVAQGHEVIEAANRDGPIQDGFCGMVMIAPVLSSRSAHYGACPDSKPSQEERNSGLQPSLAET